LALSDHVFLVRIAFALKIAKINGLRNLKKIFYESKNAFRKKKISKKNASKLELKNNQPRFKPSRCFPSFK
jgi:hypothetical protein